MQLRTAMLLSLIVAQTHMEAMSMYRMEELRQDEECLSSRSVIESRLCEIAELVRQLVLK